MEVLRDQNILVIQTAFLGDAVLTLPMIQQLKASSRHSKISVLCIPSTKNLFSNSAAVDEVIVYDKRKNDKSLLSFLKLIIRIRHIKFDLVYSPHRSARSTLISYFSSAKKTFGFDRAALSNLYKTVVPYNPQYHEVARNLSLIGFDIENEKWKINPELYIPHDVKEKIDKIVVSLGDEKFIALAPGSVWNTKVYPQKYFIDLIRMLIQDGFFVLLIGGAEDKLLCEQIAGEIEGKIKSFAGELSVVESVALLKVCTTLVCNDSAPTHLAMIADIPVLTIYCSTVPAFGFYPYNSKSKFISYDDLDCKPCGIHGFNKCPIKTFECANKLTPQMVFQKLMEIIPV